MNLFELFVKIGAKDEASATINNITDKIGKGLTSAAKIGVAAVGTATASIAALTTQAVKSYAEYEQLVGGVDTLFKDASQKLQNYASEAYKTAGMSANDYMANATAFSASLISSLGGDTEAAAEYANRAMISMSDNANKMGTDISSIVATYQSLSRGNFAMLDSLKLGYGGTKTELQRLIADAAEYTDIQKEMGVTVDASSMSFANIVNAIAVVQGKLGIAGATALEASTTIEGSVLSAKAAWSNLVTGIADDNADFEQLVDNFVDSAETAAVNVVPRVGKALLGVEKLFYALVPKIAEVAPKAAKALIKQLPKMLKAGEQMLDALLSGIDSKEVGETAMDVVSQFVKFILKNVPKILEAGVEVAKGLAEGVMKKLPDLLETIDEEFKKLSPIVGAVAAAFITLKAAMTITSTVSALSAAFGALTNPVTAVVLAVGALSAVFVAYNLSLDQAYDATQYLTEEQKKQYEAATSVANAFKNQRTESEKLVAAEDAQINKVESLWKELQTLSNEDGKVKRGYETRAKYILGELNTALGTEYELNGRIIEQYGQMKTSINDLIAAKRLESKLSIYETDYKDALSVLEQQDNTVAQEAIKVAGAQKAYSDAVNAYLAAEAESQRRQNDPLQAGSPLVQNAITLAETRKKEMDAALEALNEAKDGLSEAESLYAYTQKFIAGYEEASALAVSGSTEQALSTLTSISGGYEQFAEDASKTSDELLETYRANAIEAEIVARQMAERLASNQLGVTEQAVKDAQKAASEALDKYIAQGGEEFVRVNLITGEWTKRMTGDMLAEVESAMESSLALIRQYADEAQAIMGTVSLDNIYGTQRRTISNRSALVANNGTTININAVAQTPSEIIREVNSATERKNFLNVQSVIFEN